MAGTGAQPSRATAGAAALVAGRGVSGRPARKGSLAAAAMVASTARRAGCWAVRAVPQDATGARPEVGVQLVGRGVGWGAVRRTAMASSGPSTRTGVAPAAARWGAGGGEGGGGAALRDGPVW